jgi:chitinase
MSEDHHSPNRPIWLAITLIVAVLIASGTAGLFHLARADATTALTAAGAAFVATVTRCIATWNFVTMR